MNCYGVGMDTAALGARVARGERKCKTITSEFVHEENIKLYFQKLFVNNS